MPKLLGQYRRDESGAIAALYALALFGLVAIAGVGWDYGRMMAMDSELQNAADQAALAAATQLDGRSGAIGRAEGAVNSYLANADSDFVNVTRMANDGEGRPIVQPTLVFYESYDSALDTFGPETAVDADAKVVQVIVNGREAFFALTPIVGLISSGEMAAQAVAGLESSACNVPPLMFCAPAGSNDFPTSADIGIGLDLRERNNNSDFFAPGNFDLLQIEYDGIANNDQNRTLGLNSDFFGCTGAEITTRPGNRTPETTAFNTRFDVYPNGNNYACRTGGDFCPADLVRSNYVREVRINGNNQGNNAVTCANATNFTVIPLSAVPAGVTIAQQALPLDECQLSGGNCGQSFGDGTWPINQYFTDVHGTAPPSGLDANNDGRTTRYEVYEWERANSSRHQSRQLAPPVTSGNGNNRRTTLYCSHPTPTVGTPVVPSATQKDRRVVTVASVDCTNVQGRVPINSIRYVDLFMLGPTASNGSDTQIRAEIMGPAERADGGSGFQYYGRNKPVLLR